jgi:hypothetical protein
MPETVVAIVKKAKSRAAKDGSAFPLQALQSYQRNRPIRTVYSQLVSTRVPRVLHDLPWVGPSKPYLAAN